MKKCLLLASVLALTFIVSGCDPASVKKTVSSSEQRGEKVLSYGSNVFYFPYTRTEFGKQLSQFLELHPEKEVTAMTPDIVRMMGNKILSQDNPVPFDSDWGGCVGYFVTFRDKTPTPAVASVTK
ncbi:MAG: hypothetical protein AAB447_01505 [Patescibacteria group bacterium]